MAKHHGHFGRSDGSALGWAMAVLATFLCASAAAAPIGTQFQINTSANTQKDPRVAVAPDGSFVTAWEDAGSNDIYARRYDAAGTALGGAFQVNTSGGENKKPSVSAAADGSFVVAWEADGDIYARRYDAAGSALSGEFKVNSSSGDHEDPSISVATDGSFVIVWSDDEDDIFARRYDASGNALGGQFQVSSGGQENEKPSVAVAADGSFVIAWKYKSGSNKDVYARRYDASGTALANQFKLNTSGQENKDPVIAIAADGSFVAVWKKKNGGNKDIYARLYDASGSPVSGEFKINTSGGEQKDPSVAMAADGTFVVTWRSKTAGSIIARSYNASGTASSGETTVNTTSGDLKNPSIGMNANGQYVIVWADDNGGDVFGQLFSSTSQKKILLWREVPNAA